jgi:octaprenyl-diphosphate synthase
MVSLNTIRAPITGYMDEFNTRFRSSMRTQSPLLDKIIRYILRQKGKQMRPMFVFLSALMHGKITDSTYNAAMLIELLHTATLVHDDVVDDSAQRRNLFSVNALWKNKIAVLVGDYLLSRGLLLSMEAKEYELLQIVSTAVKQMSEGELLQIEKARFMNIREDVYFEIIRKKTASLIASCCASGAASVGAGEDAIRKMHLFGEYTGVAFQIKDDLFDFEKVNTTGKPGGIDIKERKMSLPVIYFLRNTNLAERRKVLNLIKNHSEEPEKVATVLEYIRNSNGIAYALEHMHQYRARAIDILKEFPENDARTALEQLVVFTTERNY